MPLDKAEDIYTMNEMLVNVLDSAIDTEQNSNSAHQEKKVKSFSKTKRRSKFRPKQKWFDAECIQAKRELNNLTKKYGRKPSDDHLRIRFYSSKKDYRRLLRKKKSLFFHELNQEILQDNQISWKCIKKLKKLKEKPSKLDIFDMAKFYQFFTSQGDAS